jgi:glutathione S-transferase
MSIIVHHLNNSRSQRVLWLLEELNVNYTIKFYQRDSKTNLAPPELKAIHPLGKSPVITDTSNNDLVVFESGAIIDYILRRHGGERKQEWMPVVGSNEHELYLMMMHLAEGSTIFPLLLNMYVSRLGSATALQPDIDRNLALQIGYIESILKKNGPNGYLLGKSISGADVLMSFVGEWVAASPKLGKSYPCIVDWVSRLQARPAYLRALKKGGPYMFAPKL